MVYDNSVQYLFTQFGLGYGSPAWNFLFFPQPCKNRHGHSFSILKWPNTVNSWVRYGTFAPIKVIPIVLVMTFRVVYCLCEISKLTIQRTLQTFLIHLVNLSNLTLTFRVGLRVYYYMHEIVTVRLPTCCITCAHCWTDWICDASTIYYAIAHYTHWQTSVVCIHLIHDIPHDKIPMVIT